MNTGEEIQYSDKVLNFIAVANEYCSILENLKQNELYTFIEILQKNLPELYSKAVSLPEIVSDADKLTEKYVSEEYYNDIFNDLSEFFLEIKKKCNNENNALNISSEDTTSLIEFLADIYQDIKDFIFVYKKGDKEMMIDALWECKQNFKDYWGIRLLKSLPVLHKIKYNFLTLYSDKKYKKDDNGFDDNFIMNSVTDNNV